MHMVQGTNRFLGEVWVPTEDRGNQSAGVDAKLAETSFPVLPERQVGRRV